MARRNVTRHRESQGAAGADQGVGRGRAPGKVPRTAGLPGRSGGAGNAVQAKASNQAAGTGTGQAVDGGADGAWVLGIHGDASAVVQAKEGPDGTARDGQFSGNYRAAKRDDVWLVSDPKKYEDTIEAKLKKGDLVQIEDLGAGESFNKVEDTKFKWWKVKVAKGAAAGKVGWVMPEQLESVYSVKNEGNEDYTGKSGDGEVSVHTGQEVEALGNKFGDNMFSLTYEGKDADKAQWLQFIWREVIGLDDKDAATPLAGDITTSGGTYQLTQGGTKTDAGNPKKDNYNTDSASASYPFYEAAFSADRTADSSTIYDQPSAAVNKVKESLTNGAKSAVSRAHFSTFLVKERKVEHKTQIDVEWVFPDEKATKNPPKGVHTVSNSGAADALPDTIRERFHDQYPAYKDIK